MAHRYFTQDIQGETARISGPDATHLSRVLRAKTGAQVTLCNGEGTDYTAEITSIQPEYILLKILEKAPTLAEPSLWADVFIGYAKGERMDIAVQKAVELGASGIFPFYSQNSVVKPQEWNEKKAEERTARLTRIAHEAAKQSGRGRLPCVSRPISFEETLHLAAAHPLSLFLYEEGGAALRRVVGGQQSVAIITGPEGGFTPGEAAAAKAAGATIIGLGPRILRCETAPAAALAAVMTLTGNLE